MDCHGVHVGLDGDNATLRQGQRPLWAKAAFRRCNRRLPDRLRLVRSCGFDDPVGLIPRPARIGRRRADDSGADHDRRYRAAARARPLPGTFCRGLHRLQRRGPASRWRHYRCAVVALAILRQFADRQYCTRIDPFGVAAVQQKGRAPPRLCWCAASRRRHGLSACPDDLGGEPSILGGARRLRAWSAAPRCFFCSSSNTSVSRRSLSCRCGFFAIVCS